MRTHPFPQDPRTPVAVERPGFMPRAIRATLLFVTALGMATLAIRPAEGQDGVWVNGAPVTQQQFAGELGRFGITLSSPVPDGAYWYDRVAGLWGQRGGPTLGQLPPGLSLGGDLRADASGGWSGIFINGRELHQVEVAYLQQVFGYTVPGRYWMNAEGIGGLEGGPAIFNLAAAAQAGGGGGGGGGSYTRRGLFGGTGSDGNCSYYLHPNGSSVMTGNCE